MNRYKAVLEHSAASATARKPGGRTWERRVLGARASRPQARIGSPPPKPATSQSGQDARVRQDALAPRDEESPLDVIFAREGEPRPEHFRIGRRAMRFAGDERSVLIVNDHIRLAGIPPEAHRYEVNGRTPLEWFIDRYRIVQDKQSGIVNDPNAWFDDPRDLIAAFRRIVHVSVETARIVRGLPAPTAV